MQISGMHSLERDGFVRVDDLGSSLEFGRLRADVYALLEYGASLGGDRQELRHFGGIIRIGSPSKHIGNLRTSQLYAAALSLAQRWLGDDMDFSFDMIFSKPAHSATETPFHQDAAYWPILPDMRALMCWIALDDCELDNGCMWFVPGSHLQPLRQHSVLDTTTGVLSCQGSEDEAIPVSLKAGSCTFHLGGTLHYSRGNSTDRARSAIVVTFRPRDTFGKDQTRV